MEEQDANTVPDSSQGEAVQVESTTTEPVAATTQEAVQNDVPFHNHPRFQELIDKVHQVKAENEVLRQHLSNFNKPQIEDDEDRNLDPNTRIFYQDLEKRIAKTADKLVKTKVDEFKPVVNALMQENAKLREKLFRNEHTDVPKGSVEEQKIAKLIAMGISEDEAAWAIMGPKRVQAAGLKAQEKKVTTTQVKQQANLETSSVPKTSGLPPASKTSFKEDLKRRMQEAGL